jgi:hypothetical protein
MSSYGRRREMAALLLAPGNETKQMRATLQGHAWAVRIVPGRPVVSPIVYARTWYEWTGQRQWIVAPSLELLD